MTGAVIRRRTALPRRLWLALAAIALAGLLAAVAAGAARADGDPGSDVLVYQSYFVGYDSGLSVGQQVALGRALASLASAGTPVRVAVIAHPDDLGTVTPLWRKPELYARYLGAELSLAFRGRLLIVMPDGFGFYWYGHATAPGYRALAGRSPGTGAGLLAATESAARALARAGGAVLPAGSGAKAPQVTTTPTGSSSASVSQGASASSSGLGPPAPATSQTPSGRSGSDGLIGTIVLCVLVAAGLVALARRRWPGWRSLPAPGWLLPGAALVVVIGAGVPIAFIASRPPGPVTGGSLATNPYLDPGTRLQGPAPTFALFNQLGQRVALRSYRGKVVILAFTDSECTTICPLTTTAMLDAKRLLGSAGSHVELLGVDANPKSNSIEDVDTYTELHGMVGHWQFLTGSLPQLTRVWKAYKVDAEINHGLIAHTPALFVISPRGALEKVYITQQSYAAVDQLGQLLAHEASALLAGHPPVASKLSYAEIHGIGPATATTLPRLGGGSVRIGRGTGAHLLLFFATWDREIMPLAGHLDVLDAYAAQAAKAGLPPLAAVDEGTVEPSPGALPSFLRTLPKPLSYPVAIDRTGRVADGYDVQGQPWLALASAGGRLMWYWNIDLSGWPSVAALQTDVRGALTPAPSQGSGLAAVKRELAGSPARLAALHAQAGRLLPGAQTALDARVRALRGYPVVVNVWGSWCPACRAEFGLFADASARYGKQVAFLGADYQDNAAGAELFLRQHPVSYPSYQSTSVQPLVAAGLFGTPTTFFFNRQGKLVYTQTGEYESQGELDQNIKTYALGG